MFRRVLLIERSSPTFKSRLQEILGQGVELLHESIDSKATVTATLSNCRADLVVLVVQHDAVEALSLFQWLRQHPLTIPTLAILPNPPNGRLLAAVAQSADDFVVWPAPEQELRERIMRLGRKFGDEAEFVIEKLTRDAAMAELAGSNPSFLRSIENIPLMARSNFPILITGETGTGKELCARAIHQLSARRDFPFIAVDCGALPDQLFENEMFGHARGAFTDAHRDQKGLVALALGGTLFLDEIESLSLSSQAKLLRFLQDRTYRPLGAERFVDADVNILAASNIDLSELVKEKKFRSDLFFRLSVLTLQMLPLRERSDDIPLLVRRFLASLSNEYAASRKSLPAGCAEKLMAMPWHGNVRELQNVVRRAFVLAGEGPLEPEHFGFYAGPPARENLSFSQRRARAIESFERKAVEDALRQCEGNITRAAGLVKKDRRAFGRLVKRYNLRPTSI